MGIKGRCTRNHLLSWLVKDTLTRPAAGINTFVRLAGFMGKLTQKGGEEDATQRGVDLRRVGPWPGAALAGKGWLMVHFGV